jgi:hypothetical protein
MQVNAPSINQREYGDAAITQYYRVTVGRVPLPGDLWPGALTGRNHRPLGNHVGRVPPHGETRDNVGRVPSHGETCAKEKYASDLDLRATKLPAKIPWQGRDNFHVVPLFTFALALIRRAYEETSLLAPSRVALSSSLAATNACLVEGGHPLIANRLVWNPNGFNSNRRRSALCGSTEKSRTRPRPQRGRI